jgi:very-short-patch-repair endonuclease
MPRPPHDGEWRFSSRVRNSNAKKRVGRLADRQFGRVRHDQLLALDVGRATISRWRGVYLYPELPRVYAVGHPGRSRESDLAAAVLYAGPGAVLSDGTAIWWLELLKYPPAQIHVSTPRRIRDRDGIVVHGRRERARIWHKGLPTTTVTQAIVDYAASGSRDLLRLVLANADYKDLLDLEALSAAGSAALADALAIHLPELARTRSELEILLLSFCQKQRLPIPEVNVDLHGWLLDAVWPAQKVVVEVDGWQGHRTPAQLERDHQRDLELRAAGYIILRYTWRQLTKTPAAVARDLRRYL